MNDIKLDRKSFIPLQNKNRKYSLLCKITKIKTHQIVGMSTF